MRPTTGLVCCSALVALLAACGSPVAPPAPPKAATPAAPVAAATPATPPVQSAGTAAAITAAPALTPASPTYDAQGRRDPFESLEARLGSDRSSVSHAKLTGVIYSGGAPLALVETSDGIGYILKAGDTLADGRLLEVGHNMVVFSIAPKPGATTNRVVLKLPSD